jgi:hypothetical protein
VQNQRAGGSFLHFPARQTFSAITELLFGSHTGLYTEFVQWTRSVISRF